MENQTPIEVMLKVDDDGTVSAKKVYAFLELRLDNFARWCRVNIVENEFAEENVDFTRFVVEDETPTGGKIERIDYKLSISFAKKLCMMNKSDRGEQARDYFIKVEDKLKEIAMNKQEKISFSDDVSILNPIVRFVQEIRLVMQGQRIPFDKIAKAQYQIFSHYKVFVPIEFLSIGIEYEQTSLLGKQSNMNLLPEF